MNKAMLTLSGIAVGAGLVYFLDQERGHARRLRLGERLGSVWHDAGHATDVATRDLNHRLAGLGATARSAFHNVEAVADDVLVARVRSALGHVIANPHVLTIVAHEGRLRLSGPIRAREVEPALQTAAGVAGVISVENSLDVVRAPAEELPEHTGPADRQLMPRDWPPAMRLLAGLAGGSLTLMGLSRRGLLGGVFATTGAGLLARSLTNLPLKRLTGIRAGCRAVDVHETITLDVPVEAAYGFWGHLENFPRFMSHLAEVRPLGADRSHWVALGPGGIRLAWDAIVTRRIPNEMLAWTSLPGAAVANAGVIHFEALPDGRTRVDIRMSYNPPAGAIGHAVASFLGEDLQDVLDEDLMRLKTLLEQGMANEAGEAMDLDEVIGEES